MSNRRTLYIVLGVLSLWVILVIGGAFLAMRQLRHFTARSPGASPSGPWARAISGKNFSGQPLPSGPQAKTHKQYNVLEENYHRKRTLLAYEAHGRHSPRWDKPVKAFFEAYARGKAYGPDQAMTPAEMAAYNAPMLAAARKLLATGCDDPLVLSHIGAQFEGVWDDAKAEAVLLRALKGFEGSSYPAYCRFLAPLEMAAVKGELGSKVEDGPQHKWRPKVIEALIAAADAKCFDPGEQRVFWNRVVWPIMENDLRRSQARIVTGLKEHEGTDPWVEAMAWGFHRDSFAWIARGTGFANEVSSSGWKQFQDYSKRAAKYYTAAHDLHPEFPEAAVEMMGIANSTSTGEERLWFDRAVAAQLDWMPAYERQPPGHAGLRPGMPRHRALRHRGAAGLPIRGDPGLGDGRQPPHLERPAGLPEPEAAL